MDARDGQTKQFVLTNILLLEEGNRFIFTWILHQIIIFSYKVKLVAGWDNDSPHPLNDDITGEKLSSI